MIRRATLALFVLTACDTDAPPEGDAVTKEPAPLGHCSYTNTFSGDPECKEYRGDAWTVEAATADCDAPMVGAYQGEFTADLSCDVGAELGRCIIDGGTEDEVVLVFPGDEASACGTVSLGCGFAQGDFQPSEVCEGADDGPAPDIGVFEPFQQVCAEPLPGEPVGDGPNGDVCTWEAISACTEEGRDFVDYASCDPVISQRPYAPFELDPNTDTNDPRLQDDDYMAELAWVEDQVSSCACICCHSSEASPRGASGWYVEAGPLWVDTFDADGLAMMAGWINSVAFGAFDAEDNNGFSRDVTGMPTTDPQRMQAFFVNELARLGYVASDFDDARPFGGPLYDQLTYEPEACAGNEGVDEEGQVTWSGGDARYVYILEADADNPGVPPNLDLPEGTLWRVDVAPTDDPIASGIAYGTAPDGTTQAFPRDGAPASLVSGETYYIVALADIYQPLTRCLFEAP